MIAYRICLIFSALAGWLNIDMTYAYRDWWYRQSNEDLNFIFAFFAGLFIVAVTVVVRLMAGNKKLSRYIDVPAWLIYAITVVGNMEWNNATLFEPMMIIVFIVPLVLFVLSFVNLQRMKHQEP